MDSNKIYKFFLRQPILNKYIFIDLLKELIISIQMTNHLIEDYNSYDDKLKNSYKGLISYLDELGFLNISWFISYKKTDFTNSKEIREEINIKDTWNISKIWMIRKIIITELVKSWYIKDTWLNISNLFSEKDMIEDEVIVNNNWIKEFNLDGFKIVDNDKIQVFWETKKLNEKNITLFWMVKVIEELKNFYWITQLNKELNLDESYKQALFFIWVKKDLSTLVMKLQWWFNKQLIESIEYKANWLYINWEQILLKAIKAQYFLKIVSQYFFNNPNINKISRETIVDIYEADKENSLELTLTYWNFKTWYIKTIRDSLWNNYINNVILKIEKDCVVKV